MKTDIWMPFYTGDYAAATIGLTFAEHGAYCLSLFAYWNNGGALSDAKLKAILREHADVILPFYKFHDGFWHHKRIDEELAAAKDRKESARINGKSGGNPNFQKGKSNPYYNQKDNPAHNPAHNPKDNPEDNPRHKQKINSSSSSSSSPSSIQTPSPSSLEKKPRAKAPALSDEEFLTALKANPAYAHVDIDRELGKMDAWFSARPSESKTRRRVVAWLNRVEKPMEIKNGTSINNSSGVHHRTRDALEQISRGAQRIQTQIERERRGESSSIFDVQLPEPLEGFGSRNPDCDDVGNPQGFEPDRIGGGCE